MSQLPASAPDGAGAAFAHINAVVSPTIDDLKLMVFLEASGLAAYEELGKEEVQHGRRAAGVIALLDG